MLHLLTYAKNYASTIDKLAIFDSWHLFSRKLHKTISIYHKRCLTSSPYSNLRIKGNLRKKVYFALLKFRLTFTFVVSP